MPAMFQNWRYLTFLHWRASVSAVAGLLPSSLRVDTYDGSAWVGVTPFLLSGLRPPFSSALWWISEFPETNCRTYVIGPDGRAGIWFFSLDAARWPAVLGARVGYGLPYAWSRMRVTMENDRVRYESRRVGCARAASSIEVEVGQRIEPSEIEIFLTARYRLFSTIWGRLACAEVEHEPWPLHSASLLHCEQTLTQEAGIYVEPAGPLVHFSPGVKVRVGRPKLVSVANRSPR
jgi:uncharacterized protein YqjF (DUF2071 family)